MLHSSSVKMPMVDIRDIGFMVFSNNGTDSFIGGNSCFLSVVAALGEL